MRRGNKLIAMKMKRKSSELLLVSLSSFIKFIIFWWSKSVLCGIEYVDDLGEGWVVFVFLTDELDVSELSKVKVPLLLKSVHSQLQIQHLLVEL